jgi:hypothetical protein
MPSWRRRSASRYALIGFPGWPPGNSHGEVPESPIAAWRRRVADSCRSRGQLQDQRVDWSGEREGLAAGRQPYFAAVVLDVVEGELADRGCCPHQLATDIHQDQ